MAAKRVRERPGLDSRAGRVPCSRRVLYPPQRVREVMTRIRSLRTVLASALFLAATACTHGNASSAPSASSDIIYRNEISKTSALNAYDAVRLLRPRFLAGRGPSTLLRVRESSTSPVVYLDNQRFGDASALYNIPVDGIVEIRYIGATQAQMRWGSDHPSGAILVITGTPHGTPHGTPRGTPHGTLRGSTS